MRVPGIEGKERALAALVGNVCAWICKLHMQREARQWTQTTRAILVFLVFLIIAYPVLAATCPHCPPALRHCRVARNRSRGRHVVFVAQCNGRVLHCNLHSRRRISSHRSPSPCPVQSSPARPWGAKEREREREGEERGQGGRKKRKRTTERERGGGNHHACASHRQAPRSSASSILGVPREHESGNDGRCRGVSTSDKSGSRPLLPDPHQLSSGEPHRIHAVAHV